MDSSGGMEAKPIVAKIFASANSVARCAGLISKMKVSD
jgi:hypothetical protein